MARLGRLRWALTVLTLVLGSITLASRWCTATFVWYPTGKGCRAVEVGGGVVAVTVCSPQFALPPDGNGAG